MRHPAASNTQADLRDALAFAGLPGLTSHIFRKTVATLMDTQGRTPRNVSDQLGHSQPAMAPEQVHGPPDHRHRRRRHPRSARLLTTRPAPQARLNGHVTNRPVYAAIAVSLDGKWDILPRQAGGVPGLSAGTGGEGAKFWMSVLTDLRNRGVRDVFFLVRNGLKGLPEVVGNATPCAVWSCSWRLNWTRSLLKESGRVQWRP